MNILEFIKEFPDETSCIAHFKIQREHEGVICKKCKCSKHYWLKAKWQWQCSNCNIRTTLRSGTMLEHSNMTFHKWYLAMLFMSFSKKGMSALELERQLNHSRYESIWFMMQKIRKTMGKRDNMYTLEGAVEFDEGYFEKATSEKVKLKRGRESQRQANVAAMAELTPLEDVETGKTSNHCRYFKMKVLTTHLGKEIEDTIEKNIDEKSIIFSDKSTSYIDIAKYIETHIMVKSTKQTTKTTLKWVHITISNAKRTLLGMYHKIKGKYLQLYLDEFCYKLNRRYFGNKLFDRLTLALAKSYW